MTIYMGKPVFAFLLFADYFPRANYSQLVKQSTCHWQIRQP